MSASLIFISCWEGRKSGLTPRKSGTPTYKGKVKSQEGQYLASFISESGPWHFGQANILFRSSVNSVINLIRYRLN
jgi:hypothetical protein